MNTGIDVVAIIPPRVNKTDRVVALLKNMAENTLKHEPDTLRYSIHREQSASPGAEAEDIVMVEHFRDSAANALHSRTDYFIEYEKTLQAEDLLRGEIIVRIVQQVGGFTSRQ